LNNDESAGGVPTEVPLYTSPWWDTEWTNWVDPVWHITNPPSPPAWQNYSSTFNLTQTYPYYYIRYHGVLYDERSAYFPLGVPADTFTLAWDNISVQLPIALLADVNVDGARNALDISSFIQRVTSGPYQAEADCNQDGAVNALDIAKFIYYVTGGTGEGQIVPEPATAGLLVLGVFGVRRRR
jgi:hypothetical protein